MARKGELIKKMLLKKDNRGQVAANFYSGKKLSSTPFLVGGAIAGTPLAMDAQKTLGDTQYENNFLKDMSIGETLGKMQPRVGTLEKGEAAPFMADGGSSAPNLGATGDIVFGLHNQRKG